MAMTTACIAACMAGSTVAVTAGVSLLGFTPVGVAAGSAGAWFQSTFLAGTIVGGGTFSLLQSLGATGVAKAGYLGLLGSCTTACAALPIL